MTPQPPNKPFVIDQAHLRRARNLSRESGRTVIAELEHLNNGTSDELVQQVARLFGMMPVNAAGLLELTPAFDLLPLPLARRWQCLLFRDADKTLVGVLADPFDPDLQLWLNSQARGAVLMRLASSVDLRAYLARSHAADTDQPTARRDVMSRRADQPASGLAIERAEDLARAVLRHAMRR